MYSYKVSVRHEYIMNKHTYWYWGKNTTGLKREFYAHRYKLKVYMCMREREREWRRVRVCVRVYECVKNCLDVSINTQMYSR